MELTPPIEPSNGGNDTTDTAAMPIDRAGNTRALARSLALSSTPKTVRDWVGRGDLNDYYRFRVRSSSAVEIKINGLTANADLVLLNQQGTIVKKSVRTGPLPEVIRQTLKAGLYFIRVFARSRQDNTAYALTTAAKTGPKPSPFNIEFDYRFDTNGWFTPARRKALEAAAQVWEQAIRSDFPDTPKDTRTPLVRNPQTGKYLSGDFITDRPIDDVLIFVGARDLQGTFGSTLALSGPSGYFPSETRYSGSTFQPWIGSMAFDQSTNWFIDPTPDTDTDLPLGQQDLISTAIHELAHVLGFGTSQAYRRQVSGGEFEGSAAIAKNGGQSIPLSGAHIASGYERSDTGEPLMTPFASRGIRKKPTVLDLAILDDMGYQVNYGAAVKNTSAIASSGARSGARSTGGFSRNEAALTAPYGRCGCSSCLMA